MKAIDSLAPARLKLAPSPSRSLLPSQFYVDHSHCLILAPATLAALPSTRAIPNRDVFYVADPISSIHRSSRINWIRVDSCAFVVTTNLASGSSSDSGRADQRNHLAFIPAVNAKIFVGCDDAVVRIKLAHPDQTKIRQIRLSIRVALG